VRLRVAGSSGLKVIAVLNLDVIDSLLGPLVICAGLADAFEEHTQSLCTDSRLVLQRNCCLVVVTKWSLDRSLVLAFHAVVKVNAIHGHTDAVLLVLQRILCLILHSEVVLLREWHVILVVLLNSLFHLFEHANRFVELVFAQ